MTAKEKFTNLISKIEEMANKQDYLKPRDIGEKMAILMGVGYRDLNTVFTYLTEISLLDYIRERQIMAVYTTIISMPIFDIEVAISVSGYDNQSSFGKKFKERFGITPKEAFNEKDFSRIAEQITWDMISNGVNLLDEKAVISEPKENFKFGLPASEYKLIQEAADLQALYEFDDTQSNVAFKISKEYNVPLKKAYDFVDDYCVFLGYNESNTNKSYEDLLLIFDNSKDLTQIYFNVISEIGNAVDLVSEIKTLGYNPLDFDYDFLKDYYKQRDYDLPEFIKICEDNEVEILDSGVVMLNPTQFVDECLELDEACEKAGIDYNSPLFFEPEPFSDWINEETDYANSERFEDDYDEDSYYYEDESDKVTAKDFDSNSIFLDDSIDRLFSDNDEK